MLKIVFVIDEYNDIKQLPSREKNKVEELIINMLSRSRAVGIHGIICTQYPKSNVIDTRIKAVLPGRLAFNCSGNFESMAIIDNAHAKGLPVGRCILKSVDEIQVQAPYINEKQMKTIIDGAMSGSYQVEELAGHDVTLDEILNWALENDNGYLSYRRVYDNFKDRGIRRAEIDKSIKEIENTEQIVNGKLYNVLPGEGNLPRRLVSVDQGENNEN
jgi:DNA segregation ATPase FtsK/SpoIIIE-like protein